MQNIVSLIYHYFPTLSNILSSMKIAIKRYSPFHIVRESEFGTIEKKLKVS